MDVVDTRQVLLCYFFFRSWAHLGQYLGRKKLQYCDTKYKQCWLTLVEESFDWALLSSNCTEPLNIITIIPTKQFNNMLCTTKTIIYYGFWLAPRNIVSKSTEMVKDYVNQWSCNANHCLFLPNPTNHEGLGYIGCNGKIWVGARMPRPPQVASAVSLWREPGYALIRGVMDSDFASEREVNVAVMWLPWSQCASRARVELNQIIIVHTICLLVCWSGQHKENETIPLDTA